MKKPDDLAAKVAEAMKIIGKSADPTIVERHMRLALKFVARARTARASGRYGVVTKAHRTKAKNTANALHRALYILRDPKLPRPPGCKDEDLQEWHDFYETLAKPPQEPSASAKAFNPAKHEAARQAARLLRKHDRHHPLPLTISGPYNQLAALLYGNSNADLRHVCRQVRDETKRKPGASLLAVSS